MPQPRPQLEECTLSYVTFPEMLDRAMCFKYTENYVSVRSERPIKLDEWIEIRVSRTGRLASLEVEDDPAIEMMAPGAFTQLSLPLNMYLGGTPSTEMYSPKLKTNASFVGCVQSVVLNRREVGILAEALGGVNVGSCGHACEARPCGDAECRPLRDRFTCRCRPGLPHPCPALDDQQQQQQQLQTITSSQVETATRYAISSAQPETPVPSFTGTEIFAHYLFSTTPEQIGERRQLRQ
ncbi:pikachurin-like [Copidosoma floridanum]|uniref:pikachurin-like n=1 Tax=Copidosoma floridanum TaxID=29053 RepID=UPI000C6F758E|nr:pikachurin-like [Copidosoma floridanum]